MASRARSRALTADTGRARPAGARELLCSTYGWSTEDFNTLDSELLYDDRPCRVTHEDLAERTEREDFVAGHGPLGRQGG
jgi:hypothetical protein